MRFGETRLDSGRGLSGVSREVAGGDDLLEHLFGVAPEFGAAVGDVAVAGDHAIVRDAVAVPSGAFGEAVEKHRLKAVDGGGEFGLGRFLGFKLVPKRAEFASLVGREQAEDAIGGFRFALVLTDHRGGVVGEGIAGVDFDEVVKDDHFEDAKNVEVGDVGVLGEDDDAEAERPGVLGVVFGAAALGVDGLPENLLQPIAFGDELNLADEPGGGRLGCIHGLRTGATARVQMA